MKYYLSALLDLAPGTGWAARAELHHPTSGQAFREALRLMLPDPDPIAIDGIPRLRGIFSRKRASTVH